MVAVGFDATVWDPSAFEAVTRTRMRNPTSAARSVYCEPVAPDTMAQLPPSGWPPSGPHRTHWRAYVIGSVPVQVPRVEESVRPCSARPLIAGSAVLRGAAACAVTPA